MEVLKGELKFSSKYVPDKLTKDKLRLHHIDSLIDKYLHLPSIFPIKRVGGPSVLMRA